MKGSKFFVLLAAIFLSVSVEAAAKSPCYLYTLRVGDGLYTKIPNKEVELVLADLFGSKETFNQMRGRWWYLSQGFKDHSSALFGGTKTPRLIGAFNADTLAAAKKNLEAKVKDLNARLAYLEKKNDRNSQIERDLAETRFLIKALAEIESAKSAIDNSKYDPSRDPTSYPDLIYRGRRLPVDRTNKKHVYFVDLNLIERALSEDKGDLGKDWFRSKLKGGVFDDSSFLKFLGVILPERH